MGSINRSESLIPKSLALTIVVTLISLMAIFIDYNQGHKTADKYSELIHTSLEIRLETAYAHLWMEEIMGGDKTQDINEVLIHIGNATWYTNAMLNGNGHPTNDVFTLQEPELRESAQYILSQLHKLKSLTEERYEHFSSSFPGSEIESRYDDTFKTLILELGNLETSLNLIIEANLAKNDGIHFILAVVVLLIATLVVLRINIQSKLHLQKAQNENQRHQNITLNSHTDPVTKIANRRAFDEKLDLEFAHAMHNNMPLSLMMIDIDFFKAYKDQYGSIAADQSLISIASILNNICNSSIDLVAHYGNGFAIILPNNTNHAKRTADAILKAIENAAIPNTTSEVSNTLSVSIGLVEMNPSHGIMLPEELIEDATKALNQAIESGRNRVVEIKD